MESENKSLEEDGEQQTSVDEVSEDLTGKLTIADTPQQEVCEEVNCEEDVCEKEMSSNSRPSTPVILEDKQEENQSVLETDDTFLLADSKGEVEEVEESANAAQNDIKPCEDEITPLGNDVKTLENDIKPLENDVKPLENDTKALENDIKLVENDIKPVESDKDKVDVEPAAAQAITSSSAKRRKAKGKVNAKQTVAQINNTDSRSQMAYCYFCNQSLNSASQAISHFQGRKHIRNQERRLGAIDSQIYKGTDHAIKTTGTGIKPAATEEPPKETLPPADRKFYCNVCRKYLNSAHQYTMHIESDKHRKKELKSGEQAPGNRIKDKKLSGKQVIQKKEAREGNRRQRNQARFYQMKREEQISPRTWPTPTDMDFHRYNQWLQCQEPVMPPRGRGRPLTQHRRGMHRGRGWHGSIYNGNQYVSNNNGSYSHFTGGRYRMPTDVASRGGGSNGRQSSMIQQPTPFYSQPREDKHQGPKPSPINYPSSELGQSRGYSI